MIHHIWLSVENEDDPAKFTEPPEKMLKVQVIGGVAVLSTHPLGAVWRPVETDQELTCVAARSLVRALQVLLFDEADDLPDAWAPPKRAEAMEDKPIEFETRHRIEMTPEQGVAFGEELRRRAEAAEAGETFDLVSLAKVMVPGSVRVARVPRVKFDVEVDDERGWP